MSGFISNMGKRILQKIISQSTCLPNKISKELLMQTARLKGCEYNGQTDKLAPNSFNPRIFVFAKANDSTENEEAVECSKSEMSCHTMMA